MRLSRSSIERVAIAVVVALLQLMSTRHKGFAEARSLKKAHTTTTAKPSNTSTESPGESRIEGGVVNPNVPSWLGTAWSSQDESEEDGRLAGHAIGLPGSHFLVHNTASRTFDKKQPFFRNDTILPGVIGLGEMPRSKWYPTVPERVAIPTPAKFDATEFFPSYGLSQYNIKEYNVADSQFDLVKLDEPDRAAGYPLMTFDAPKLERDTKNFGDDCRAYGWTNNQQAGGSRSAKERPIRTFVDFPLFKPKPEACDEYGQCNLLVNFENEKERAELCGGFNEEGMPVVCGKEKKLTYLLQARNPHSRDCSPDFKAFHVPRLARILDRHVGGIP